MTKIRFSLAVAATAILIAVAPTSALAQPSTALTEVLNDAINQPPEMQFAISLLYHGGLKGLKQDFGKAAQLFKLAVWTDVSDRLVIICRVS